MFHFPHTWDFFYRHGVLSFLKESFVKVHTKQKWFGKWNFYVTKHPTDLSSDFNLLIFSRAFVPMISVLQPSFSKVFWLCDGLLLIHTCSLISSLARAWGSISLYYTLLEFAVHFSIVSNMVIFIPGWKRHLEKLSSMGKMRQMIYSRLITEMS